MQRLKQQQIAPAYNLIGILRARRKKWLGEILCQQDDSLTRIEVLRLAFAVTLGVMEVRGTILEHAPDFSSPADLIRKVGRARPEVALRHYTATERAYAETKQNEWSRSVAQLRGEDYIPERSDDESEDSEPKD